MSLCSEAVATEPILTPLVPASDEPAASPIKQSLAPPGPDFSLSHFLDFFGADELSDAAEDSEVDLQKDATAVENTYATLVKCDPIARAEIAVIEGELEMQKEMLRRSRRKRQLLQVELAHSRAENKRLLSRLIEDGLHLLDLDEPEEPPLSSRCDGAEVEEESHGHSNSLIVRVQSLTHERNDALTENAVLRGENANLREKISELQVRLSRGEHQNRNLRNALHDAQDRVRCMDTEVDAWKMSTSTLQRHVDDLTNRINANAIGGAFAAPKTGPSGANGPQKRNPARRPSFLRFLGKSFK